MTGERGRHDAYDELISASLHDDLTADERRRLDLHLEACPHCTETLAAFGDQRRIMTGLRHVPPPRDLSARVRAGIESGAFVARPWWRRPAAIFAGLGGSLAVVAGMLLAFVLVGTPDEERPVGDTTPSATVMVAATGTASARASVEPAPVTPAPTTTVPPSPTPTQPPPTVAPSVTPTASAVPASPEPDVFLALTGPFDNLALTVRDGLTGETRLEADTPPGPPIAAALSPDGEWIAYIVEFGQKGTVEVRATRVAGDGAGGTVVLGESLPGSFAEHLFWSPDGGYLAFTRIDPDGGGADVWIFDAATGTTSQVTNTGNAYAGSWIPGTDDAGQPMLWISTAGESPTSHLWTLPADGEIRPGDPGEGSYPPATNVFQPIVSPNGAFVIYWSGRMEQDGDAWLFVEEGAPWLAEHAPDGDRGFAFTDSRPLFSVVTVGPQGFSSAAVAWGPDGDSFAVWQADWTGASEVEGGQYPDPSRIYFSQATDPVRIAADHALDVDDVPEGSFVVDVKIAPTGRHLLVTAARPRAGVQDAPRADLLLITRNLGDVADEVRVLGSADDGWFGPAAFEGP